MGKLLERIPRDLQAKIKAMSDDDLNNFIRKANELIAFSAGYPAWLGMDLRRFARDILAGRQALKGGEHDRLKASLSKPAESNACLSKSDENCHQPDLTITGEPQTESNTQGDPLITSDIDVIGGQPRIVGTRISIANIMGWVNQGNADDQIIEAYPDLTPAHIEAAKRYAELVDVSAAPPAQSDEPVLWYNPQELRINIQHNRDCQMNVSVSQSSYFTDALYLRPAPAAVPEWRAEAEALIDDLQSGRAYWEGRINSENPDYIQAARWNGCCIGLNEAISRVKSHLETLPASPENGGE